MADVHASQTSSGGDPVAPARLGPGPTCVRVRSSPSLAERTEIHRSSADSPPSHDPRWLSVVESCGGWRDASRLYEFDDGVQALLPMVRHRRAVVGRGVVGSLPAGWGFGGLATDGDLTEDHHRLIWDDLLALGDVRVRIRPHPLESAGWAATRPSSVVAIPRRAHVLDLAGGFETVWSDRFIGSARTGVRKAERSGVEVTSGADDRHLTAYRQLLTSSRRRWAEQHREPQWLASRRAEHRDPFDRIAAMVRGGRELSRLWIAWHEGRPAAGIVVLFSGNAHYTRGAMDRDLAARTRANDLLQRTAIEWACELGCRWYHMGESGRSSALSKYKEQFGARPYDYEEYLVERLPIHRLDTATRHLVKRAIGFRDA